MIGQGKKAHLISNRPANGVYANKVVVHDVLLLQTAGAGIGQVWSGSGLSMLYSFWQLCCFIFTVHAHQGLAHQLSR